jgi:hypothetical protein
MDGVSEIVLRLADPAARGAVLTPDALLAVAGAGYDLDPSLVTEPATATFERFDLAVPLSPRAALLAQVRRTGEAIPWEVAGSWDLARPPVPGADAVWAGRIVVRTAVLDNTIVAVGTAAPEHQADGRDRLTAQLRMSPPGDDPAPVPVSLPVVVAFLAADPAEPRELLRASAVARQAAAAYAVTAPPAGGPARLVERLVCWVVPATTFDDASWPGAVSGQSAAQQRDARLQSARGWLAGQGITVITTEPAP